MRNQKENGGCNPHQLKYALDLYLKHNNIITTSKRRRIIAALICASRNGWKLTRFDTEHIGDHCLNTTVSEISLVDNILVARRETKRPTRFGKDTNCKEYWLDDTAIAQAEKHLGIKAA